MTPATVACRPGKTPDRQGCWSSDSNTVPMETSCYNLRKYVRHAPIPRYYTGPGSWGSGASPLTAHLMKGHQNVKLSPAEWQTLLAWIDCNAPYIDDYRVVAADPQLREDYRQDKPAPGEGRPRTWMR